MLTVTGGREVAITTREAVPGDDLATLDQAILDQFRADDEAERADRIDSTRLQLRAIRRDRAAISGPGCSVMNAPMEDPMVTAARLRGARHRRWLRDGEPNVARRLGQIGVLGWIVVMPMLIGIFAGRWLDGRFHSGLFWTAPLLMFGAALGCWSAWKWMGSA